MELINATEARKSWSSVIDTAVREKPQFIKRTRDKLIIIDTKDIERLLLQTKFSADKYTEKDGSITLALRDLDLAVNEKTEKEALISLATDLYEYAEDFYKEYSLWSNAPNRKAHIPYIIKALAIGDVQKIKDELICQAGEI